MPQMTLITAWMPCINLYLISDQTFRFSELMHMVMFSIAALLHYLQKYLILAEMLCLNTDQKKM